MIGNVVIGDSKCTGCNDACLTCDADSESLYCHDGTNVIYTEDDSLCDVGVPWYTTQNFGYYPKCTRCKDGYLSVTLDSKYVACIDTSFGNSYPATCPAGNSKIIKNYIMFKNIKQIIQTCLDHFTSASHRHKGHYFLIRYLATKGLHPECITTSESFTSVLNALQLIYITKIIIFSFYF